MAITIQDIHSAADQIAATGKTPTLSAIRASLGAGSYTTISEAMKAWKAAHQSEVIKNLIRESAPTAITDKLVNLGADIWATSIELANERLQAERDGMETARKEMEADQREAADLADQLASELEIAQSIIAQQEESLRVGLAKNLESVTIIDAENKLRAEAERASEKAMAALDETHSHIKMLTESVEHLKAENGSLKAENSTLKDENNSLMKESNNMSFDLKNARILVDNLQKELVSIRESEAQAKQAKTKSEIELAKKTGELMGELKAIKEENLTLKDTLDEALKEKYSSNQKLIDIEKQLAQTQKINRDSEK